MVRKCMKKLIMKIKLTIIIFIFIEMQASEHALPSHLDSPMESCLETQLGDCVEKQMRKIQFHHQCIRSSFLHCFSHAVAHDPAAYIGVKKCKEFCDGFKDTFFYSSCLLKYYKFFIKKHQDFIHMQNPWAQIYDDQVKGTSSLSLSKCFVFVISICVIRHHLEKEEKKCD